MTVNSGQCNDEGEHPRHDQQFDRIHAHGAQRVGLLVELHHADFGGECTARAAGDDDRGQQHAHFAQHRDGHQIDDEDIGAESRELLRPQIGDDHADQERDERDDRNRRDAGFVDMPRKRRYAQRPRARESLAEDRHDAAEEVEHVACFGALQHRPPTRAGRALPRCSAPAVRRRPRVRFCSCLSFCRSFSVCGGSPSCRTCKFERRDRQARQQVPTPGRFPVAPHATNRRPRCRSRDSAKR